jgi:hypothetical protein
LLEVSIDPPALSMYAVLRSLYKSYDLCDEQEPFPERQPWNMRKKKTYKYPENVDTGLNNKEAHGSW